MRKILNDSYFNNTLSDYFLFFILLVILLAAIKVTDHFAVKHFTRMAEKTKTINDDKLILLVRNNLLPVLYFGAFYFSTKTLTLHPTLTKVIDIMIFGFTMVIAALFVSAIATFFVDKYMEHRISGANSKIAIRWTNGLMKALIWSIALILFLDNIGIKISSLVTGLGIGGIALAFAAQSILVDLFCCFTIFFDKPFEIGDFIVSGEQMGTVEHIGMKNTRIRALNGEQLILSNSDLVNSRISNYKTMEERRVLFRIGVTYDTNVERLKEIPEIIKTIIEGVPETRFGRVHFCTYGPSSLDFEIAYYVLSSDYDKYMDINQEINLLIKKTFDQEGIKFAFPTQTVQVYNLPLT
ncbi:MAG: mechanosensitive ion channel family protein [Eubacteriales bacterium]|nr:mechanosensitive ion channel family protein [Eubacteriales bacterium]